MEFVAIMLFSQQVFHLECFLLLLFRIKSQPGVACIGIFYKTNIEHCFLVSKNEKMTLPHDFVFVFIWYFIGAIFQRGVQKFCTL